MKNRTRRGATLGVVTGLAAALTVAWMASVGAAISPAGVPASASQYEKKVTICHRTVRIGRLHDVPQDQERQQEDREGQGRSEGTAGDEARGQAREVQGQEWQEGQFRQRQEGQEEGQGQRPEELVEGAPPRRGSFRSEVADRDRDSAHRAEPTGVVGHLHVPNPGGAAATSAAGDGVNRALADRPEEARVVRLAEADLAVLVHTDVCPERGERLRDRRVHSAVHETDRLEDVRSYRHAALDDLVGRLVDDETVVAVERGRLLVAHLAGSVKLRVG